MKYNIVIGGTAGQGIDTLSILLEKILQHKGYFVFSNKDYMSRVRGGHNFIQVRFGTEKVYSHFPEIDMIIALDENTADLHIDRLKPEGVILCDESIKVEDSRVIHIPMKQTAAALKTPRVFSTVALGAILKFFGLSLDEAEEVFKKRFKEEVLTANLEALQKGHQSVASKFSLEKGNQGKQILINGNDAIAMGALAGGVSFYSAYPMTPATSIMTYLSKKQRAAGILVEQVEDEIAAINMALGASYAGARAMTGSSGGGVSLMVETFGLAGITETPLVLVDSQRPGPATGLPTRTEQSDLSFILTASHGEFPRMVIAVRNPEDAFYQTARALNLADKYQTLVLLLTDQYLADAAQTIPPFDFGKVKIERHLLSKEELKEGEEYNRYTLTESGISPRLIPGKAEGQIVLVDSDEHTEEGHITESGEVRIAMMEKRMKKLELLQEELLEPEYAGVEIPEILLLGWGSTYGPIKEAVEMLQQEGIQVGALLFGDLYPLPTKLLEKYANIAKSKVNVEQNFTGQLAKLIRMETGIKMDKSILKYDGRQLSSQDIYARVKSEVL